MTIKDTGPSPQSFDLETTTVENTNYRTVAWSGKYLQLTLMSIPVGEDIGLETHPETDQFLRLDAGRGRVQMGPAKEQLDFDQEVEDGWAIFVLAGTWHNVTNIGDEPMQLYTVYAPVHHAPGKVHPPRPPPRSRTRTPVATSRRVGPSSLSRSQALSTEPTSPSAPATAALSSRRTCRLVGSQASGRSCVRGATGGV